MAAFSSFLGAIALGALGGYTIGNQISAQKKAEAAQQRSLSLQAEQNKIMQKAQTDALASAKAQQKASEKAIAVANKKSPDVGGILKAAAAIGGGSGTMLTGPMGITPDKLSLSKKSLLGE